MASSVFVFRNEANKYQLTTEQASQDSKFGSMFKYDDCHSGAVNQNQSNTTPVSFQNF